jgi:hypothetical protein
MQRSIINVFPILGPQRKSDKETNVEEVGHIDKEKKSK